MTKWWTDGCPQGWLSLLQAVARQATYRVRWKVWGGLGFNRMRLGFICSHGDLALLLSPTPRTAPATQHTHTHTGRLKAVRTMCVSSCLETDCQPGKTHLGFIFMCHPRFKNNRAARKASLPHPEPTQRPLILAMNTTQASQSPGCKPRHAAGSVETLQRAAIGLNSRPHPPDFLFPLSGARAAGEVWEGGRRLGLK